jgi:FkbM family methyltransferase
VTLDRIEGHTFVGTWVTDGGNVVDLGMNQGNFARAIRKQYNCNVVGVEANPLLARGFTEPGAPRCFSLAISARKGTVRFFIDPGNSEAGSLLAVDESLARPVEVEGIPFAEFYAAQGPKDVDLLKIDIEGAEIDLFESVEPSILRTPSRSVLNSMHSCIRNTFHLYGASLFGCRQPGSIAAIFQQNILMSFLPTKSWSQFPG